MQLYLHFPFCKRKCFYCDFCSAAESPETVAAYCFALEKEIWSMGETYAAEKVDTVFLGGGTPTLVPPAMMGRVLHALHSAFEIAPDAEFTSEGNPGTLTEEWLQMAMKYGVNRLSLGVQAAQDALLKQIGRIHTMKDAEKAVHMARRAGIRNLNLDAMFGLPGQTETDYLNTLRTFRDLGAEHISAYSLILEEGTPLHAMVEAGKVQLPDEDETAEMYEHGITWLEANGYPRYEISNFARPGFSCRHNIGYWQGAWYLGLGVAAHSMLPPSEEQKKRGAVRIRRGNAANVQAYICALKAGQAAPVDETEEVSAEDAMFETMMLGLRTVHGVEEKQFERLFGKTPSQQYGKTMDELTASGLARWIPSADTRRFALTARGLEMQNEILVRFMQ